MSDKTDIEKIYSAFFEQEFPLDLTIVIVWLSVSIVAMYLPILNETILRIVLTLPIVLFIPGYCLIAALFPKDGNIDLIERIALSIGLSIAVVPLIGLGLNFTPWGIRLETIVISLTFFTLGMIVVAYYRRSSLPYEEQFRIPFSAISYRILKVFSPPGRSRVDRLLSVVLTLVAIVALLTTLCVIIFPQDGERFTEFFILGENRTAANYPDVIRPGQNYPMYVGIVNHEYRDTSYTIETWLLRTEFDNVTNTSHIIAMDPSDRLSFTLANNETKIIPYNLSVRKTGYDRVEFLLFNESIPGLEVTGKDRINASYRYLHLWETVEESE